MIFPVETEDLFRERAPQMRLWGIPVPTITRVRARVHEPWSDDAGGWVYEWRRVADEAASAKRWLLAAACYGAAKFPVVATPSRRQALAHQVECYVAAAPTFPVRFERRILRVPYRGGTTPVATHMFGFSGARPVVCLSGGVDTFKMELHRLALGLALAGGVAGPG